ncbi:MULTISPECIES: hypothetical protein [unclassified Streptomyces]|uniref:hypothetical protein n=1 Tax=unclassified Streptomyces TaxID=2593676 RepID=UPI00380AD30C
MIDSISTVISTLVALGALAVSFIVHRHQVRRAHVLDARERRLEAAEQRMADRQAAADRGAVLAQASMIDIRIVWAASRLVDGLTTPELKLTNVSNQPVLDLRARIADAPVDSVTGGITSAGSRSFPLTRAMAMDATVEPRELNVDFTDAAGIRWRRDGSGGIREGTQLDTGEWTWAARESPAVVQAYDLVQTSDHPPMAAPSAPTGARSRAGGFAPVVLALATAAILAVAIWAVFVR